MPNGNHSNEVLKSELLSDLDCLNGVEPLKGCSLGHTVKSALRRLIRINVAAMNHQRVNTALLVAVLLIAAKVRGVGVVELVINLLTSGGNTP